MSGLTDNLPGGENAWLPGIVEGFFGRAWSWEDRHAYVPFLREHGLGGYLYAPKGDTWFRKQWFLPSPRLHREALSALCAGYREAGLEFGVGLSPYELYRHFNRGKREQLRDKIGEINDIGATTLCLLFDDMPGALPDLARRQAEIVDCVLELSTAQRVILCPTYYSFDPVLSRVFGECPERYLEDLGELLDPGVELFWTGPRVLSSEYPEAHLREVAGLLRRRPVLWDNYPVNDAQRLTPFLHLRPFVREAAALRAHCAGHFANPMNQSWLSRIPLASLGALYRGEEASLEKACLTLCGEALGALLLEDAAAFQDSGLDRLDQAARTKLRERYAAFPGNPYAREILEWLDGAYAFDPACLT